MPINFKKSIAQSKSRSNERRAVIGYDGKNKSFYAILHDDSMLPVIEDYMKTPIYYSRPENDAYPDKWTRHSARGRPMGPATLRVIMKVWATVKPGLTVYGDVVDNKFIINYESTTKQNTK